MPVSRFERLVNNARGTISTAIPGGMLNTIPYRIKEIPPPVHVPPRDRSPVTGVVVVTVVVAALLGIGALARRALRRR